MEPATPAHTETSAASTTCVARARVGRGRREGGVQVCAAGREHLHLAAAHRPEALDGAIGVHRACMH